MDTVVTKQSGLARACDALAFGAERILALALICGISLNVLNVFGRYLTGFTLVGVDEIEIYILIWNAFLGAAVVTWRHQHLRMDVLLNACPSQVRKLQVVAEMALLLVVAAFAAYQSFLYVERIFSLGAVSDIARVPTWVPHSAICLSFTLMVLIVLVRGAQMLRTGIPDFADAVPADKP